MHNFMQLQYGACGVHWVYVPASPWAAPPPHANRGAAYMLQTFPLLSASTVTVSHMQPTITENFRCVSSGADCNKQTVVELEGEA